MGLWRYRAGFAFLAVGALLFHFNNCSQPYELETRQNQEFLSLQSNEVVLASPEYTNDENIRFRFSKPYAREVFVTASTNCNGQGEWQPYAEDFVFTLPKGDGAYPLSVKFRNFGKVETSCTPLSVTLDQTPPVIQVPLAPATFVNTNRVTVQFTTSDNISGIKMISCSLNGTPVSPCDGINGRNLATGPYTFTVQAQDGAGNETTQALSWTVDTQVPSLNFTATPSANTQNTSATFAFAAADVGTLVDSQTCALDGGAATDCASPVTYDNLSEAAHQFTVSVRDQAGNSTAKSYNWRVDVSAPTLAFVTTPASSIATRTATYSFTAMDNGSGLASVLCALDAGTPAACTSPRNLSGLADGDHVFVVIATDKAGNAAQISHSFSVDATAPTISFSSKPDANVYLTSPQAVFAYAITDAGAGVAGGSVQCKLDASTATPCSPMGITYNNLTDGSHTFVLSATDVIGNATSVTANFRVDATPPTTPAFTQSPSQNGNKITFKFSAVDATSGISGYRCVLNPGGAESNCSTTQAYSNLAAGNYSFVVYAMDFAGHRSSNLVYDFTVP